MGYTIYTAGKTVELQGAYKCSKCNKINYFEHKIAEKVTESLGGTWHGKKTEEKMFEKLSDEVESLMNKRVVRIKNEAYQRLYYSAEYKGCCQYCKNREPWQRLNYAFWDKVIYRMILLIGIIVCLVALLSRFVIIFLVFASIVFSIVFSYFIIKKISIKRLEKEIAEMDKIYLPVLFFNEENMYKYMEENDPLTLKKLLSGEDDNEFCVVCGAMLTENESVCHVCGAKRE